MTSKTCRVCGEAKPLEEFNRDRSRADGHQNHCRGCASVIGRQWREKNPDKLQAQRWLNRYRRRMKHYGHEPVVEEFTRDDVIARWGDGCWHCPDGEFEELDHFPVSVRDGGSHTLDNVRPACRRSNLQGIKGAELRRELVAERNLIIRAADAEMKSQQSWADHGYVRAT